MTETLSDCSYALNEGKEGFSTVVFYEAIVRILVDARALLAVQFVTVL